nr:translocation/assembly module TamB [Akkermansiaceae bacterium]
LAGTFTVDLTDGGFHSAAIETTLEPADPAQATPVVLGARYEPGGPVTADLALDGLRLSGTLDTEALTYQGTFALEQFATNRLEPWLDIVAVELPGEAAASAAWSGRGELRAGTHQGTLTLTDATWRQPEQPPLGASASLAYDWPGQVTLSSLEATAENQTMTLAAELADDTLTLRRLLWRDGDTEMAEGEAKLPVPPDLADWRGLLADNTRPAAVAIRSRVLPLELLNPWLPPAARLDTRSTGSLRLNLSGTYAKPALDLEVALRELRSPENPQLPPADLKLTAKSAGEHLALDARLTTPGYAPAILTASVPFHPRQWAEDPAAVTNEILTVRLDLPRVDLSRFASLTPTVRRLSGTVSGNLTAAGPLRKPEARGTVRLERGAVTLASESVPPIEGLAAEVALTMDRVTVNNLRASLAGGSLDGGGSLTLTPDFQPGNLDLQLRGRSLPLLRNDMLILRANADLRLAGPWDAATLTGEVAAVDSVFYRDIELLPIGRPFTTPSAAALPRLDARAVAPGAAAAPIPAPFRDWRLGVNVRTQDPFLIRGNLATGRVDVAIRAAGTVADPRLDGTAQLSDLVARLPFSTLTVRQGTVRFTPGGGLDPTLEIRGRAEPRPYQVVLNVYGKASAPQIMLTSSPPLPESEIMTLLATGTTTEGLEDTAAAANRAIQLFAEEVRRGRVPYANRLRPFLGLLDRVDFSLAEKDPYSPDSYSTATISLTDRWYFSAGMSEEGNTRFMGIWRISFK